MGISGEIRIRHFPHWEGLEFVEARDVVGEVPRHSHESFCVGLVETGVRSMHIQDRIATFGPGQIWLIKPGESHTCSTEGEAHSYQALCFEPVWTGTLLRAKYEKWIKLSDPTVQPSWSQETKAVFARLSQTDSILESELPLMDWLGKYFFSEHVAAEDEDRDSAFVKEIRSYLDEHYADNPSIIDLAKMAGLSPFHLERTFRKSVGVPIHLYQKMVRLRRARKLLRDGMPIAFAAAETGFADQSHFSRTFKAIMGITPGEYTGLKGR